MPIQNFITASLFIVENEFRCKNVYLTFEKTSTYSFEYLRCVTFKKSNLELCKLNE